MAVTLKDIAKAAGVSITTVSRVVNNRPTGMSDEKRAEIQQIITEMGYRPNTVARSLVTKQTKVLGIVLPNIVDPFFAEIARGIQDTAEKLGYSAILLNTDDQVKKTLRAVQLLKDQRVDGILFYSSSIRKDEYYNILTEKGMVPVVLLGHFWDGLGDMPSVFVDYHKNMKNIVNMLVGQGHRKIAYVAGNSTLPDTNKGVSGYISALIHNNIGFDSNLICQGAFTLEGSKRGVARLLDSSNNFTAVICENDLMAAGVLELLEERGIAVPEEISVTGFDNTFFSRLTHPKLTTLDFPKYEMGRKSVHLLLEKIETKENAQSQIELECSILLRASTQVLK